MFSSCVKRVTPKYLPKKAFDLTVNIQPIRCFSVMAEDELNKRLDKFQDLFVEARDSIEDVVDSAGSTYFDDDAKMAEQSVDLAVQEFQKLLDDLKDADQKNRILRSNGLKVEQLKGELEMALKGGH